MAAAIQDFPQWLNSKLQELNADETVFGSYIQGILDSDETSEEKNEDLQGILSEFVESVSYPISTNYFKFILHLFVLGRRNCNDLQRYTGKMANV